MQSLSRREALLLVENKVGETNSQSLPNQNSWCKARVQDLYVLSVQKTYIHFFTPWYVAENNDTVEAKGDENINSVKIILDNRWPFCL